LVDIYAEKKKTKNLKISAQIESEIAIIENKNVFSTISSSNYREKYKEWG